VLPKQFRQLSSVERAGLRMEIATGRDCNDPLISRSGVTFPEGDTDERSDGRRDQALDGPTQVCAGP